MPTSQRYIFGNCELDLTRNCLLRDGREIHLRQKAFHVLLKLIEGRGQLVSKDELFRGVWPDTAVTDDVLVQVVKELRRSLGDDPHLPAFIKTVPKSGYRFVPEVTEIGSNAYAEEEVTRVELEIEEETRTESHIITSGLFDSLRSRLVAAVASTAVIATGFYFVAPSLRQTAEIRLPAVEGKTSLAVMFFENSSGDAELDWLREGLADMLITNLSRSPKVTTLSRGQIQMLLERGNYAAGYGINQGAASDLASKAGVKTLVMGDFSRLGETIHVNATLIDAATGDLKAAESITVDSPEKLFNQIDLLSLMLVKALDSDGVDSRIAIASVMTDDLEAYRCYSLALEKAQGLNSAEAIQLLERAISLDPSFAMAHARLGHTYAVTWGHSEKARPYLARAFELSDRLSAKDRLYILAWYSIANLDYPRAIDHFRQIIDDYPLESEAYLRLGNLLRGERKPDEAIDVLKRGLIVDPESPTIHNTLGLIHSERGDHAEALAMHQKYVELAPHEANAHDSLGMSLQWAGHYDEAIRAFERALELNPGFEIARSHMGVAYFQTGRYDKAIECINKYLETAPSDLEKGRAYSYLARIHRAKGKKQEELQFAKKAYETGKLFGWDLLVIMLEKGDRRSASKIASRLFLPARTTNRGSRLSERPLEYYKGVVALAEGDSEGALVHFRTSLQNNPYTWDIDPYEDCLGQAYLKLGRYGDAVAEFERVLRINPNYPLAHFHLGEAYRRSGIDSKATDHFREFLSRWKAADDRIPEVAAARRYLNI